MRAGAETCQVCVTRNMTDRTDRQSEIRVNFCHETHRTNIYISLSSEYFPVRLGLIYRGVPFSRHNESRHMCGVETTGLGRHQAAPGSSEG